MDMDTLVGGISFFYFKTEVMLQDPTFQDLIMALATFIIGWLLKRPQEMLKK